MNFGLDYLSAHLQRKGYDLTAFEDEASSVSPNPETGEITGCNMPRKTYRTDTHIGDVVVGAYSGSQIVFANIVTREDLTVTRVDLCCDIYSWEGLEDGRSANSYASYIYRLVRNYLLSKGRRVQKNESGVVSGDRDEPQTYTLGARGSEWQLRIYARNKGEGPLVRFEWQLRKELARQVWSIIRPSVEDQALLSEAFAAIESEVLEFGLLQIPYGRPNILVNRAATPNANNREKWVRTQVLSACLAEFKESGINLPELLLRDFNRHFAAIRDRNIEDDKLTRRLKAERLIME